MNDKLRYCYEQVRQILGNNIEPYESVTLVEKYRQYWRPAKIRVLLLAESHIFTRDEDRKIIVPHLPNLPGYPTEYAKFVYCLAYGERHLTGNKSHPKRDGTPQFWKIFYSCDNLIKDKSDFRPVLSHTPYEQRLNNKIELLLRLKQRGIWLIDSSTVALYNKGKKPPNKVMSRVIRTSWECYTRDIIREANPEHIICIGNAVWNILKDEIKKVVGNRCTHLKQPNARLRSEEHMENFRRYSEICSNSTTNVDKKTVVITYLMRGIEDFFIAFAKFDESFSRYEPFFNAMGFEMVAKAYLLSLKSSEYEEMEWRKAIRKIDKIAIDIGHDVSRLTNIIEESIGKEKLQSILDKKYDGFTGSQLLDVLKAAYFESRYPVPEPIHKKFPADKSGRRYWDPLNSSGLHKFCYAFCREVLRSLKSDFGITLTDSILAERISGEAGIRFCNLLFGDNKRDFVSE